jgi:ribonuclease E
MATEVMSQAIEQVPPIFEPAAAPIQEAAPAPVPLPAAETAIVDEMTRAPAEVALAPVPVPAPEPEAPMPDGVVAAPAPAPTPAPVESAEAAETLAMPAPVKPLVDISVALQDSGLVMVETSREKANAAPQAEPEMRLGRKPRTAAVISNEPMMQVETRK